MKILHVVSSTNPDDGGVIESIKLKQSIYKKLKIKCEILCLDDNSDKWLKDKRLPTVHCAGSKKMAVNKYINLFFWLDKYIRNYDLVVCDGLWQFTNFAVWKTATKHNVKYQVIVHGMLDPWFNKYIFKYIKKLIFWQLIQHRVLRDANLVLFTSKEEKNLSKKSKFYPYNFKQGILSLPIDKSPYIFYKKKNSFINKFPELKKKKIILYLGRINKKKGLDLLIKAFDTMIKQNKGKKEIHLVIAGPYEKKYYIKINNLIKDLKLGRFISLTGPLYDKLKWDAFNSCHIFCLPTHQENFGITIVESLSVGKPVITTNKTNIWKIINNYNAAFISNDDYRGLVKSLTKWNLLNRKEYNEMSKSSFQCFKENFYKDKVINDFKKIIKK